MLQGLESLKTAAAADSANASAREAERRSGGSTDPKFGEIYQQIQARYGVKEEKPREIKKTLGKDDFLRIMITQMKNQDPTSPMKPDQMAAQMAQFSSVEQLSNLNQAVKRLSNDNQPMQRLAMTNLIGKTVTVNRDRFPHVEGSPDVLSFNLPAKASQVKAVIVSDTGEPVFEKNLGQLGSGENSFTWNGKKLNTLPAKGGEYMLRLEATDESGRPMELSSESRARVVGITFEGSEPAFLVGDSKHQEKIAFKDVVRIESDGGPAPAIAGGNEAAAAPARSNPNFFTFQKGVGSRSLDPMAESKKVEQALAHFQPQQQAPVPARPTPGQLAQQLAEQRIAQAPQEKGFPNGLHDTDDSGSQNNVNVTKGGEIK